MKLIFVVVASFFLVSCSTITIEGLHKRMCVATVKHYEKATDDFEATAYHAHFVESCSVPVHLRDLNK